jgi:hypothetical protein
MKIQREKMMEKAVAILNFFLIKLHDFLLLLVIVKNDMIYEFISLYVLRLIYKI